jgi:hypothetical protein
MTKQEITDKILVEQDDFEFYFDGVLGSICPFPDEGVYSLAYNGDVVDFDDMDALLEYPMFGGRTLADIVGEIDW